MKLKVAQVIGLNTDQKAAQVLSAQREGETFLAVLQLTCDDAFTKGRLALSDFEDFYFDFEGTHAEKLNNTFLEAQKKFAAVDSFDLVLGSISGKVLYLIGQGEIEVYLKRADQLSPLLSIGSPAQIISGFLQPDDRVLLATKSLTAFLGSDLDKSLSLPIDSFEEEVSSRLGAHPIPDEAGESEADEQDETVTQCLAGLVIEIEQEEELIPSLPQEEESGYQTEEYQKLQYQKTSFAKEILTQTLTFVRKLGYYFPKSGRSRLSLALILVVIIAGGVVLQYKSSRDKERQAQFDQNLQAAKDEFAAARGLSSLNPAEAKGKIDSAKAKVNLALSLYPENLEAKDLQKRIEEESSSILQQYQLSEFPVFLDLDLIKKDFKAQNLSLSAGKILLLDKDTKTLVAVDVAKKSHQIISGKEKLGDAKYASINGSLAFVYSEDKGVVRVDVTSQKEASVSAQDTKWGQIRDIAGFAGNVYLLDVEISQIWKYLPTSSGYSERREYLTKGTKADFANSLRMQIESSIYVLKTGGEILRFTRGEKDHFSLGGLDKGVKDPKSMFISSDSDNLYILDSGNSRLLILTKTGEYKGAISGDKFATATDLVVDEKGKKVYLLEGSKIYQVDLK